MKSRRRQLPKKMVVISPVQKLYDTCKKVFSNGGPGIVPPPNKIEKLRAFLDDIKPEDLGLSPDMPYFRSPPAGKTPVIRYLHLYECDKFSMGIFCFPPSGVIPLHDHPGMTVFSKLLFGKMHIKSYDWVVDGPCDASAVVTSSELKQAEIQQPEEKPAEIQQPEEKQAEIQQPEEKQAEIQQTEEKEAEMQQPEVKQAEIEQPEGKQPEIELSKFNQPDIQQPRIRLAKVKVDSNFTAPCNTRILYPAEEGNMHCFTAATACAILDVLSPPYADSEGRPCTYYYDFPIANFSVDGLLVPEEERESYAWLQDRGKLPEELTVVGGLYAGPKFLEK